MTKSSSLRRFAFATALLAAFASTAFAQNDRVSVPSSKSFDQTVAAFKAAVSKGGMMVMSTIDQGNILKMTGLQMKGTTFLIGNPNVGKKVFAQDPAAGLYLPIRVYIYENSAGKTFFSYDKPSAELKQFNNTAVDKTAAMLNQKLSMMAHMVTQ
jgi:uncharacterized protein (DUF302 family)